MIQDPLKSIFWLWLFKSLRPCLAGRWLDGDDHLGRAATNREAKFTRLSGIPAMLPMEGLSWKWGVTSNKQSSRNHRCSIKVTSKCFGLSSSSSSSSSIFPKPIKVLYEDIFAVRPMGICGNLLLRRRQQPSTPSSSKEYIAATNTTFGKDHAIRFTKPLIPMDAWEEMTGTEFEEEEMVHALSRSGLELCSHGSNPYVEWKVHNETDNLVLEQDRMAALKTGRVLVYVGKAKKKCYGSHLPLIKTQAILPLSANDMSSLLMDSSRVKIYNKLSLGRKDVRVFNNQTKIVSNTIQPPIGTSKVVSVTLMHSRSLQEEDCNLLDNIQHKNGNLVVSRAVPYRMDSELASSNLPRSDILMGVNLLQDLGPNQCLMTSVTHVYSPSLPTILARRLGVLSAKNFVRDIRNAFRQPEEESE